MEKFSALLALCEGNPPVTVDSPHNGQWLRALMFSLNCAWTNSWTNNRDAGNLRRHRTDYDVAAMVFCGGDAGAKDLLKTFHYGRKPHLPTLRASIWFQLAHRPLWHLTFDWSSVRIIDRHWFYEMVSYRFDYDGIRLFFFYIATSLKRWYDIENAVRDYTCAVHSKNYTDGLHFVVLCCGLGQPFYAYPSELLPWHCAFLVSMDPFY